MSRLILKPKTLLVEKQAEPTGLLELVTAKTTPIGKVVQTASAEIALGQTVLYNTHAGLQIKSGSRSYLLMHEADILAVLE